MRCMSETPAYEMHIREMYTREIYAHRSVAFLGGMAMRVLPSKTRFIVKYTCICGVYARQRRRRRLASAKTMSTSNPYHGQNAAVLLSRAHVFTDKHPNI
jgi:hypothetical protein